MSNMLSGIRNGKKLIKRYFLVDYENVQSRGLTGLSMLKESDAVTVYYSKNADTLTFELHMELNNCKAKMDFQKVGTGVKNALDFQLSSQLGFIINQNIVAGNKDVRYYVVSMDNGFSCLCDFWSQFGANVVTVKSVGSVVDPKNEEDKEADKKKSKNETDPILAGISLSENEELIVTECIEKYHTYNELHNALQRKLKDSRRAGELYKYLKAELTKQGKLRSGAR